MLTIKLCIFLSISLFIDCHKFFIETHIDKVNNEVEVGEDYHDSDEDSNGTFVHFFDHEDYMDGG